jgi:hypothetical protein
MDKKFNFYLYIVIVIIIYFSIEIIRKIILKNRLLKEKFDFNNDIVNLKTLDNFNNKFNTGVIKLPLDTILIGVEDTTLYEYYDVQGWNYYYLPHLINYLMDNIHPKLNKTKYYYILYYWDGYNEMLNKSNVNIGDNYILTFSKYYKNDMNTIPIVDPHYVIRQGYTENFSLIDNNYVKWENKINICIWRGDIKNGYSYNFFNTQKNNVHPREYFIKLYKKSLFNKVDFKNELTSIPEQIKYKYILDIDGFASTWSATVWKLYSGSVLLKQKSVWSQWYYDDFQEYVHYVPIANDFSDLNQQIDWCINNDDKCKIIVENAKKFVLERLNWERVKNDMIETFSKII